MQGCVNVNTTDGTVTARSEYVYSSRDVKTVKLLKALSGAHPDAMLQVPREAQSNQDAVPAQVCGLWF
jgi:hypothetical protein